jgi:hypothetical protein
MRRAAAFVVLSLLLATRARAAVAIDAAAATDCLSGAGVTSLTCATLTVGVGSNRAQVCSVIWGGTPTTPTVKWDAVATNQSMTAITGATVTNTSVATLYGLVAPTSGNKTTTVAWTGSLQAMVVCVAYTGVNQTGGATSFAHGVSASAATGLTAGTTITSAVGNAVVAEHFQITNTFTAAAATKYGGSTANTGIDNNGATFDGAWNWAAGASTVATETATNQNNAVWGSIGADVVAAGGAAACTPSLGLLGVGRCGDDE